MSASAKEKIALFVCHDLTGLLLLNQVVPGMKAMGYEPVIFNTGMQRNRRFKIPTPASVAFFNASLLNETLIPLLESRPISAAPNYTFRQLAIVHGVEYREITDVNDPEFLAEIAADPSYKGGIASRFLQVFEHDAIKLFHEKGFIWNLHSGLLPKYKGLLTPFRAIANGEKTYGMTLHDLNCGVDEGDLIQKGELPLDPTRPVLDLYMDTVPMGAQMILLNLALYQSGQDLKLEPQPHSAESNYYTNPTSEEFQRYLASGIVYADPENAIDRISAQFSFPHTILREKLKQALSNKIYDAIRPVVPMPEPTILRDRGARHNAI